VSTALSLFAYVCCPDCLGFEIHAEISNIMVVRILKPIGFLRASGKANRRVEDS